MTWPVIVVGCVVAGVIAGRRGAERADFANQVEDR
jgi:hypothetical protein